MTAITLFNQKLLHPKYIIDDLGNKAEVILPMAEFEELLEDLADLITLQERREEPMVSHQSTTT
jgi:hypothetical protein